MSSRSALPSRDTVRIVIPAYQAENHVGALVTTLRKDGWRVLVIDDGSTDQTGTFAKDAGAEVVRHEVNRGKGAALQTGFDVALRAGDNAVITMDADGQHDPAHVSALVAAGGTCPVVIGSRRRDLGQMPRHRRFSNSLTSKIMSARCGQRIPDSQSGYRFISTAVLERVTTRTPRYQAESELLIRAASKGFRIGDIPIQTIYGAETSHIHPFRDTWNFVRLVASSLFW